MIGLVLAASILGSVPSAVEAAAQLHEGDNVANLERKIALLEERLTRDEEIAIATWKCFNRALVGAGADLMTTATTLARCPTCREANPLGFNSEARVALKLTQLGTTGAGCYVLNKDGHKTAAKVVSWTSLLGQLFFAGNNLIHTIRGK